MFRASKSRCDVCKGAESGDALYPFQVPDSGANEAERDLMEGQETAIIFLTEPESAAYPAPGNTASPVPDSGVNEALAENNRALKRRLMRPMLV